ncbi:hypothetical protein SAMN05443246_3247 [Paenibacillus sp. GP183]|nr:hypothetical protein SAMN05443246_3247 [Paenibacillus sp. GP183]
MDLLLKYKWIILFISEILAWIFTFLMFYARYWIESKKIFIIFTVIALLTGWVPHLALMVMSFKKTKTIGLFEISIIILLIYGLTIGKKHILKMDNMVNEWTKKKKRYKI